MTNAQLKATQFVWKNPADLPPIGMHDKPGTEEVDTKVLGWVQQAIDCRDIVDEQLDVLAKAWAAKKRQAGRPKEGVEKIEQDTGEARNKAEADDQLADHEPDVAHKQPKVDKEPPFDCFDPGAIADEPVPPREWYIDGMLPAHDVTLLSGDGGVGKSLLSDQIAVAGALGISTIGLKPKHGRTLVLAAEDDRDELHRRIDAICREHNVGMSGLRGQMLVIPGAGIDLELMRLHPKLRVLDGTIVLDRLLKTISEFKPELTVLDTAADLFGGDEINRRQVRQFVGMLRCIAIKAKTAILLLSHPSVAGLQTGTGLSGSTAWNNSVRSRLYLTADKDDDDLRVLKGMKANYSKKGGEIKLRWQDGAFVLDDGKPSPVARLLNKNADKAFLELLSAINASRQRVSPSRSPSYAPTVMSKRPDRDGASKAALEEAMHRHLASGAVAVVTEGSPSRQRQRLVVVADELAQGRAGNLPTVPSNGLPTVYQRLPTGCAHTPPITPVPLEGTNGPLEDGPAPANDNDCNVAHVREAHDGDTLADDDILAFLKRGAA